jgi:Mg2+ and Co2+ transporter CorA
VFLMGVTEFYRARTDTKMTIAAERLAVIAAITLPITSLSSVIGMNVIVNDATRIPATAMADKLITSWITEPIASLGTQ